MVRQKTAVRQTLTVTRREAQGTRSVRRLRHAGLVPAIVYGRETTPVSIAVNGRALMKLLHSKMGEHALVTLRLEDAAPWEKPVLVKAVQHDPVGGQVIHVDFHSIVLTERLRVKVPVTLKGEAVGVKQDGGILEHFLREVEVECLPTDIPTDIEFDVTLLKIGDAVHVRDLAAPKQAKITSDPAGVIVSVQVPKEEKPAEAAAVAEPEVIREKKEEEAEPGEAATPEPPARPGEGRAGEAKKEAKPEK